MNNMTRLIDKTFGTLEILIPRYRMGMDYMDEHDQLRLAEALQGIDMETVMQIVDRNHAKYLDKKMSDAPDSFDEVLEIARSRQGVK